MKSISLLAHKRITTRKRGALVALLLFSLAARSSAEGILGGELNFEIGGENRWFTDSPAFAGQSDGFQNSFLIEAEWYRSFGGGDWEITAKPFYRQDFQDADRTHFDLRELHLRTWRDWGSLTLGLQKIFWGVTESQHLVDVINQTDLVESPDGEDKLGQPMLQLTLTPTWGTLDFFVLPYFRERTSPGTEGRLRTPLQVSEDSIFENDREEEHTDFAFRYSHYFGAFDVGLSYFHGTSREPFLIAAIDTDSGSIELVPYYPIIDQFGLDLQYTTGGWLWKLEAIARDTTNQDTYTAITGGFEYTFVGIADSTWDLGTLLELHFDSEGNSSNNPFNNDVFVGFRFAANDSVDTSLLVGMIYDIRRYTQFYRAEFSRRLGQNFTIEAEFQGTTNVHSDDPFKTFEQDNFLSLTITRFF